MISNSKSVLVSNDFNITRPITIGSSGGVVVKRLACEVGAGVRFPTSPLRFPRLVISCFQVAIRLKDR